MRACFEVSCAQAMSSVALSIHLLPVDQYVGLSAHSQAPWHLVSHYEDNGLNL